MTVPTVVATTTTNSRVNDADSNTSWGNFGSGGGAPASEAQLAYQGSGAVNTKTQATSLDGIDYDPASGAEDMTGATRQLWLVKMIVSDSFDLNTTLGVLVALGSSNSDYREWNIAGSGENSLTGVYNTYPPQGGYLITAINPDSSTTWRNTTDTGTPDFTAVDWFGVQCAMVVGAAKNENLACDAIDVGTGLQIYGGTGGDPTADMADFAAADQGTGGNRWGYVREAGGIYTVLGRLDIARNGAVVTITEWTDDSIIVFPDAYYAPGDCGFKFHLHLAGCINNVDSTIIGKGAVSGALDTRPDFTVESAVGTLSLTGTLVNHRNVVLTSACTVTGASIECADLTQDTAEIENATIRSTALTNVALMDDATFGTTTDLHDSDFVQAGAGHVFAIDDAVADAAYQAGNVLVDTETIDLSVPWPTHATDDIGFLISCTEESDGVPTLAIAAGFTLIDSIANAASGCRNTIWWHRATSAGMSAPSIEIDTQFLIYATMITQRGCRTTGDPWTAYTMAADESSDTSSTFPSVTTSFHNQRVMGVLNVIDGVSVGPFGSGHTNAGLASITEQFDEHNVNVGNGGGINVFDADDAVAGATGTTSITLALAGRTTSFMFALASEESNTTITNCTYTGFGADGAADAVIDIRDTTGAYTFTQSGGDTPTIKTDGAQWRIVSSTDLTFTGLQNPTEVRVYDAGTQTEIDGTEDVTTGTVTYQIDDVAFPDIDVRIITKTFDNQFLEAIDMTSGNVTIPIVQIPSRVFFNP